ncbi:MAG: hypothetical protein ACK6DZ_12465 [Acidobacteriota bacterium]
MRRPLLMLNLVLLAGLVAGSMELRRRWLDRRGREAQVLRIQPLGVGPAPVAAPEPPGRLQPMQYFEVAERFLFARDRNPQVIVEKKPEPPPKPMPNFPLVYGVMDIGMGPTVFMSYDREKQQGYRLGDKVGEFTLKAANQKDITFEWEVKPVTKPIDELRPKPEDAPRQAEAPAVAANQRMNSNVNSVPVAPPPKIPENVKPAPGQDIGMGRRGCIPGDNSPAGTVADGYKKVSYQYAFGPICYWESAR